MYKTLCVFSHYSNSGKTTTTMGMASNMCMMGLRVLMVDMDPTAILSHLSNASPQSYWFKEGIIRQEHILPVKHHSNLYILPANITLSSLDARKSPEKHLMLAQALGPLLDEFDVVIIDTPPGIRALHTICMMASECCIYTLSHKQLDGSEAQDCIAQTEEIIRCFPNESLVNLGGLLTMLPEKHQHIYSLHASQTGCLEAFGRCSIVYSSQIPINPFQHLFKKSNLYKKAAVQCLSLMGGKKTDHFKKDVRLFK